MQRRHEPQERDSDAEGVAGAESGEHGHGSGAGDSASHLVPLAAEVQHLVQFLLAQLRWEFARIIHTGPHSMRFAQFDAELRRVGGGRAADDLGAMESLMNRFFQVNCSALVHPRALSLHECSSMMHFR